jgi:amino acid adenylation domain-containing protein
MNRTEDAARVQCFPALGGPLNRSSWESTLDGRFRAQAAATPGRLAVIDGDLLVDYATLDAWSDRITAELLARGTRTGDRVALCMPRGAAAISAILGILKVGAAYVPVSPDDPAARKSAMLKAVSPRLALVSSRADVPPGTEGIIVGGPPAGPGGNPPAPRTSPDDLAYIIFTSGSSGVPKGVAVEHRSVAHFADARIEYSGLTMADRILQFSVLTFDVSVQEIFTALLCGAALVIPSDHERRHPDAMADLTARALITVVGFPAALLSLLEPGRFPGLRLVSCGGESLPPALVGPWSRGRRLVHVYGPTEATVATTYWDCVGEHEKVPPIGLPRPGSQVLVLDEHLRLVPDGEPGELCVAGPGVARGYADRPDLTAERFVPNPYSVGEHTSRLYRTGDLARRRPDGSLEFLGRADRQVKLRGLRIEPGEIEAVLSRHPGVANAAVVVAETAAGPALAAYLVARPGHQVDADSVYEHARAHLPEYMVPAPVMVDALPVTSNGKLDRAALPSPRTAGRIAPRDANEAAVAAAFADVLGTDDIGVDDDFLALGGNSLNATRLVTRLRSRCGAAITARTVFDRRTVAAIARAVAGADAGRPVPAVSADPHRPALSQAQRRLWFLDQLTPGVTAYVQVFNRRLRGSLDIAALRQALRDVLQRHDVLRSHFPAQDGEPYVEFEEAGQFPLVVEDLSGCPAPADRAHEVIGAETEEPFDLQYGPLVRLRLLKLAESDHVLAVTAHHTVFDGWSARVFQRDLGTAYAARLHDKDPAWPPLPLTYASFAERQRHWPGEEVIARQVRYWRDQLSGAPMVAQLPTDRGRPPLPTYRGGVHLITVPAPVTGRLAALAGEVGASLFMVMISVFASLAARYSGTRDLLIGSPVFGRPQPDLEDLVGFFANSLPLRVDLTADPSFTELVRQARDTTLAALNHQDVPFEQLVEELSPPRDLTRNPVFQLWFDLAREQPPLDFENLRTEPFDIGLSSTRFDLELRLWETPGGELTGQLVYARDLFDDDTISRFAAHLSVLTEIVAADPLVRPLHADILTDAERDLLCHRWASPGPATGDEPHSTIQRRFAAQVARTPRATALVYGARELTYAQLDEEAGRLAGRLRSRGVGAESLIGLCLPRGVEQVIAALGVLKAGAGYLGMDPGLPPDRLAFQLADSGAALVVTDSATVPRLPASPPRLLIDGTGPEASTPVPDESAPDALVYVIYTSGSTGRPKGVMMAQRPLLRLLDWQIARSPVASPTLQFASMSFDVSFQELFSTWLTGGTVVLLSESQRRDPEQLAEVLRRHQVRRLFCPPMVLQELADTPSAAGLPLAEIVPAGERLQMTDAIRDLLATMGGVAVDNQYGPTEAHAVTAHRLTGDPRRWPAAVPIGRPLPGTRVLILDQMLRPVPIGVPGEICIGGDHIARGYLGRPDITAERFVPDPFGPDAGARLYRTGDRACWRPDGTLRFLGRTDDQVKVRGYRVEPGEIEAVLRAHPDVADAAVTPVTVAGFTQLAAYVVPRGAASDPDGLRAHLKRALPEYMVPAFITLLPALPQTRNGKLDRSRLPDPVADAAAADDEADRSPQEQIVAGIWASCLGMPSVGRNANFFEIGGHSLLATKVMARIRSAFGVDLPLRALFENPTIATLVGAVEEAVAAEIDTMSDAEVAVAVRGQDDPGYAER